MSTATVKPGEKAAVSLSASEMEQCIRGASPTFHLIEQPVGQMTLKTRPEDDATATEARLHGFDLRPNTITNSGSRISFSTRVYKQWIKLGALTYNGMTPSGVSYTETEGRFWLDASGPGPFPGDHLVDKASFSGALSSLADVAVTEAVKLHLTEGGDERLHLVPTSWQGGTGDDNPLGAGAGVNKYHCPPYPVAQDIVVRGSCTCSPPSPVGFEAARSCLRALWDGSLSPEEAFNNVRSRISVVLGVRTAHHVVLHPSGTDAEFTALFVGLSQARRLGCSGVVNVVVGAKEVGSNTATAAGGRHFSRCLPLGRTVATGPHTTKGTVSDAAAVDCDGLCGGVQVIEIAAREEDGSVASDFDGAVLRSLDAATFRCEASGQEKPFFVMHAVDGSKLGSHITSSSLADAICSRYGDHVLFVLDACQARTDTDELDWYLSRGAVVLVTASKFYGAPGFCAAALVPQTAAVAGGLGDSSAPATPGQPAPPEHGLGSYLTQLEVPTALGAFRNSLPEGPTNVGLLLRWSCGVAEMERFARAGKGARQAITHWVHRARGLVCERKPHLLLLGDSGCDGNDTVPPPAAPSLFGSVNSIVSFGVRHPHQGAGSRPPLLGTPALRRFHRWLTMDISAMLPASAADAERHAAKLRSFIGQPVDLGEVAVLRLAMSAPLASDVAEGKQYLEDILEEDGRVLDKILLQVKYWDALCEKDGA